MFPKYFLVLTAYERKFETLRLLYLGVSVGVLCTSEKCLDVLLYSNLNKI